MWWVVLFLAGLVVLAGTLATWWLLSGFGCEMNAAGCATVRLDRSPDALRIFLPFVGIGIALMGVGLWKRRNARSGRAGSR